ncbi:MAG: hypothetical protein HY699_13640 [Deltaproteobacteria bacterium]|nr:hypothetical protein [Deltaproteobacteria bacterium]
MPPTLPAAAAIRELARFGLIFAALLALHAGALSLPHHWDALNRVHNAHTIAAHGFSPFLPAGITFLDAQWRPPLLLELLALAVTLKPYDLIAAHVLWLGFAALAVYMTDRLGRSWHPLVGAVAALWLATNPLFFAQSEVVVLEVPITALTVTAAVCLLEGRRGLYLATAAAVVLFKEFAQFALPGLVLFAWWAAPAGKRWRAAVVAAAPFLAFVAWLVACKLHYGWFLSPYTVTAVGIEPSAIPWRGLLITAAHFGRLLLQAGFWDGNWAATLLVLGALVAPLPAPVQRRWAWPAAAAVLAVYAVYPSLLAGSERVLIAAPQAVTPGGLLQDTYAQLQRLRLPLALASGLGVLALGGLGQVDWRAARLWLSGGIIAGYVVMLAFIQYRMVRYLLPAYPFILVTAAAALWQVARHSATPWRRVVPVAAAVVLLFVSRYWGTRAGPGNVLESNLEFRDMVFVRRAAAAYLEQLAPRAILAAWPETMELRFPFEGYVTRPLAVVEDPRHDAEVLYLSPQSSDHDLAATLRHARPEVTLQPLQRFEHHGKSVALFRIVSPRP